jgi:hypothetical protein
VLADIGNRSWMHAVKLLRRINCKNLNLKA